MKPTPLGIEFYETVATDCYYVDKTGLLESIVTYPSGTCLSFTRPRRFGKTSMLSMLQSFFEKFKFLFTIEDISDIIKET